MAQSTHILVMSELFYSSQFFYLSIIDIFIFFLRKICLFIHKPFDRFAPNSVTYSEPRKCPWLELLHCSGSPSKQGSKASFVLNYQNVNCKKKKPHYISTKNNKRNFCVEFIDVSPTQHHLRCGL